MDYFSFCLNSLCLTGQGILHIFFISRLTGKKHKVWLFTTYFFLLCVMECFFSQFALSGIWAISAELPVLYSISRFALGNPRPISWIAAIFAVYISQLSFGIVNSAEAMLFPHVVGKTLLYPLVLLATLGAFIICAFCYEAVLKSLSLTENNQMPYVGILLFPGLFSYAAQLYILQTSYSALPATLSIKETGKHGALLFLQALGLGALFCTLYAYRRLRHSLQAQAKLHSLDQAAQAQKIYIAEAQMRYQQTKAFRHDIKNHLSVLSGLLNSGKSDEGKAYLQKLETASATLSFPYQTGNPVVDILLREKLNLAKTSKITTEVSLLLPNPCGIDDFDLCVIFANALDNAIQACQLVKETRTIRICGERQGDFYMLAFENSCLDGPLPPAGTGLSNIRSVTEKYHGSMLTEKNSQCFCLHILLNLSLQTDDISRQIY